MELDINLVIVDVAIKPLTNVKISKKTIIMNVELNVTHFSLLIGASIIVFIIVLLIPFITKIVDVDLIAMHNFL